MKTHPPFKVGDSVFCGRWPATVSVHLIVSDVCEASGYKTGWKVRTLGWPHRWRKRADLWLDSSLFVSAKEKDNG